MNAWMFTSSLVVEAEHPARTTHTHTRPTPEGKGQGDSSHSPTPLEQMDTRSDTQSHVSAMLAGSRLVAPRSHTRQAYGPGSLGGRQRQGFGTGRAEPPSPPPNSFPGF